MAVAEPGVRRGNRNPFALRAGRIEGVGLFSARGLEGASGREDAIDIQVSPAGGFDRRERIFWQKPLGLTCCREVGGRSVEKVEAA